MIQQSFQELYSAKSDDELLALAADSASLREDAKAVLVQELERRNLQQPPNPQGETGGSYEEALAHFGVVPSRPKVELWPAGLKAPRALVFVGGLLLNTCIAVLGTSLLRAGLGKMFHPHSFSGLLWKWWTLDSLCAAGLGFSVSRLWRSRSALWTWVLPVLWFAFRFVPAALSGGNQSVLVSHSVWSRFAGSECMNGLQSSGCRDFILFILPFTLTLIRGVSYSLGVYISFHIGTIALTGETSPLRSKSPPCRPESTTTQTVVQVLIRRLAREIFLDV